MKSAGYDFTFSAKVESREGPEALTPIPGSLGEAGPFKRHSTGRYSSRKSLPFTRPPVLAPLSLNLSSQQVPD